MLIKCPNCSREYKIDDSRIPTGGTIAKCHGCGQRFKVAKEASAAQVAQVICPKCGHEQAGGVECSKCGIVFEKLNDTHPELGVPAAGSDSVGRSPFISETSFASGSAYAAGQTAHAGSRSGTGPASGGFRHFSKGDAIRFGWETVKSNLGFFIGIQLLAFIIILIPSVISEIMKEDAPIISALFNLASSVLQIVLTMGFMGIALMFCDDKKPRIADLFSCLSLFLILKYFFASILYGLSMAAGFILLIIPGIIVAIRLGLFLYFIVDTGSGPIVSLKASWKATTGSTLDLFLLGLLLMGINILGFLALLIGLFISIPLSIVASAYAYRSLAGRQDIVQV